MSHELNLARFQTSPLAAELATQILPLASTEEQVDRFLARVLPELCRAARAEFLTVARGARGKWEPLASTGRARPLPTDWLADVLDADAAGENGPWSAAPLVARSGLGELLVMHKSAGQNNAETVDALAALLGMSLEGVRQRQQQRLRLNRLEAILSIAGQWQQTFEMPVLLQQMAEASTRLLGAERASIFLWDKPKKELIGRPALGVEGNELRIPDTTGIVGQVVHSGQPRRVDAGEGQEQIDRRVDKQLKFQTRTLLCVPLRGRKGELFGAFEMINKRQGNFSDEDEAALIELASHASIALENTRQIEQLVYTRNRLVDQAAEGARLIGECKAIEALRAKVRRVAETDLAVLVLGENGTGKEVVSQSIHYLSRRRSEPFVAVNCAAIAETLLESELFGHEKGAFTDARETRIGKFELASGGTIFLDEIGDMSLAGQAKLLRVLEEKVVVRVGGSAPIPTDSRVIAATNQNLAELARQKKFREDLFFRLTVVTLEIPPLRDRGDDVLLLAEHFLRDFCAKARRPTLTFTDAARRRLLAHRWPGNVRELRNLTERLAYLCVTDTVDVDELAFTSSPRGEESSAGAMLASVGTLTEATRQFQIEFIKQHIARCRSNMTDAAESLGLHRSNLYRKMRQLGMDVSDES